MTGTICSPEQSRALICEILRNCHAQLTDIIAGVGYDAYGFGVGPVERVDALELHRWAGKFVYNVGRVICHEDPLAYQAIIGLLRDLQARDVTTAELVAAFSTKFIYLTIYTMAVAAQRGTRYATVEVIEHFSTLLTKVMKELLTPAPIVF